MPASASASGFIVLDKPPAITSRAAVDHAQRWFPRMKLGHAGTLDPAATGVLVVGVGSPATRLLEYIQQQDKVYQSTFLLGGTSTTDDGDGTITVRSVAIPPSEEEVIRQLQTFVGTIAQVPPAYSAALISGQRAHELARKGKPVILQPRPVTIYGIALQRYTYPEVDVEINCGKGTYVRSLARDLGEALQTGAYVKTLRRTRIGSFTVADAIPWSATAAEAQASLQPLLRAVAQFPQTILNEDEINRICQGQRITCTPGTPISGGQLTLLNSQNELIGLGEYDPSRHWLSPLKIFRKP